MVHLVGEMQDQDRLQLRRRRLIYLFVKNLSDGRCALQQSMHRIVYLLQLLEATVVPSPLSQAGAGGDSGVVELEVTVVWWWSLSVSDKILLLVPLVVEPSFD
jgi:hypothetical protein